MRAATTILLALLVLLALAIFASPAGGENRQAPQTAAGDEGLEEFVPSEKISADREISFPVDI